MRPDYRYPLLDAVAVQRATETAHYIAEEGIKHALEFMADASKEKRLAVLECKTCFYFRSSRIGGAAMTTTNCRVCDKDITFGSTNVDCLCMSCGAVQELCVRCGGDLHMRPRRVYQKIKGVDPKKVKKWKKLVRGVKIDLNEPYTEDK